MISGVVVDLVVGELDELHGRVAGRFGRAEPRALVREYLSGLAAGLERKNGWTLSERAGEVNPAWYAHIALSMPAMAGLAAGKALAAQGEPAQTTRR